MKAYLLEKYAAVFNTCPHCALPAMTGPPMEIHIDENAEPYACHKPNSVPIHWDEQVHNGLLQDEALDVLERVPDGEPVLW